MDLGLMIGNVASGQVLGNVVVRIPGAVALVAAELALARRESRSEGPS